MDPVRFAVSRPYTVAVAVILALLFSVLAYQQIPTQLKPTVESPIISVGTIYRGAGPVEVEEQVTRKIEDLLQSVNGLEKLTSTSVEGLSTVRLEFEWGVDKSQALVDVNNKMTQLANLPPEAEQPVVALTEPVGDDTAMWIVTQSHFSPTRVRQILIEEVEPLIERVEGVADLFVVGGEEREIRVVVDPERMVALNLGYNELAQALRRGHLDLRGGTVETPTRQFVVRTEGRSSDLADIEDIVIRRGPQGTVRVGQVARVLDAHREVTSVVHSKEGSVCALGVNRETGSNVIRVIAGVEEELDRINARFASQGVDLFLEPVYRDTTYLYKAIDFVQNNLLLGAGLALVVLLLFLRSLRSVLVVGLSIPVSLVTVFLVMDALGRSLNVISLAGLAFASGMVVDNAIVVLENSFRHLERGKRAREAAVDGGREVWGGVLAATLTTIAVFLPILGIEEEAGQLFADLAIAISAAVGLSLVVALTVVPTLTALFFRERSGAAAPRRRERKPGPIARLYGAVVRRLTAKGPGPVLEKLALLLFIAAGAVMTLKIIPPAGYLPNGNRNLILFLGQPIPGTRAEALESHMAGLEDWFKAQPEMERYFLVIAQAFNGGGVVLKDEVASGEKLDEFLERFRPMAMSVPGFRFMVPIRASLFQDSGKQFAVEITGSDLGVLSATAQQLQQQIGARPGVQPFGVNSDYVEGRPELQVHVDHHRAAELGMSVSEVGAVVETAIAGRLVSIHSDKGRDYDVTLIVRPERVSSLHELESLPLVTPSGARTTLGALATVEQTLGPQSIQRLERKRSITLTVNLKPDGVLQGVMDDVEQNLLQPLRAELPSDYGLELGGSADKFSRTLDSLTGSFWLAVLISYLLLVALFRSWLSPIVILVSVPLAMSGGLLGITLASGFSSNATFDLLSMLGFVILAGVVVNNAILIVHQANNLREGGMERRAALTDAARSRLRPILMSVTTSVFGMLPLAIGGGAGSELYQGLAAVVVGGLMVSTLFTLVLVPALVSLGWDLAEAVGLRPRSIHERSMPTTSSLNTP